MFPEQEKSMGHPSAPQEQHTMASQNRSCSPRSHIGSQPSAKSRARKFCFRTQFKEFDQIAEVIVGPEKTSYKIHKDIVAAQSPFFAAALNGEFIEGKTWQVSLPDVEARIFEHVLLWFYTQSLEDSGFFFKDGKPSYFALLDIYSLADQLCVEALRNAVVNLVADLADQTNAVPTPTDTCTLYERIRDNSPLRRLVLDLFAFKKTENLITTHPGTWHPTFLRELIGKLKRPEYGTLTRHELRPWRSLTWTDTKACELCRDVLRPGVSANTCGACGRIFCCGCVVKGLNGLGGAMDWSIAERECKPWGNLRGKCQYHEHAETEKCDLGGVSTAAGSSEVQ